MCIQQVARTVRRVVDDASGHTARREAASDDRRTGRIATASATTAASAAEANAKRLRDQTGVVSRKDNGEINRRTKAKSRRSRGFQSNIFTSLLGDSSFGKSIKSAAKLGQTN